MKTELRLRLEYNWDKALLMSPENPFPLAPTDLVHKGLVTRALYAQQNKRWQNAWGRLMILEFQRLARKKGESSRNRIEIWGSGLSRCLIGWVPHIPTFFEVGIRDKSLVACAEAMRWVWRLQLGERVKVSHGDLESWELFSQKDDGKTVAKYQSQFIQNQPFDVMEDMMRHNGYFLRNPGTVVYMIHACGEDNPEDKVEWRNTTPYTVPELRSPLEEGLGGPAEMKVLKKHKYYHQTYTLFRITAA